MAITIARQDNNNQSLYKNCSGANDNCTNLRDQMMQNTILFFNNLSLIKAN